MIGEVDYTEGGYNLGHNVQVGYYAQNQAEALYPQMTLLETMEMHAPPEMRTRVRSVLGAFMFTGEDQDKKVSVLSGGERARLALACLLLRPFNLLLLDEPTNHLDMISKEVLKEALMNYDGTLIVVSHDREFLEGMATRTIEFRDKKLYEYLGDINYFLEKRELDNMRDVELKVPNTDKYGVANAPSVKTQNSASQKSDADKKRIDRLIQNSEKRISDLEKQIADVEKTMTADNFYNSKDAQKTLANHTNLKKQLETEMENWEMATMELEA